MPQGHEGRRSIELVRLLELKGSERWTYPQLIRALKARARQLSQNGASIQLGMDLDELDRLDEETLEKQITRGKVKFRKLLPIIPDALALLRVGADAAN